MYLIPKGALKNPRLWYYTHARKLYERVRLKNKEIHVHSVTHDGWVYVYNYMQLCNRPLTFYTAKGHINT